MPLRRAIVKVATKAGRRLFEDLIGKLSCFQSACSVSSEAAIFQVAHSMLECAGFLFQELDISSNLLEYGLDSYLTFILTFCFYVYR